MKQIAMIILFLASSGAFAETVGLKGERARDLMEALFRSGITLQETEDGLKTEPLKSILCKGHREHEFTAGIFSIVNCHRDVMLESEFHASNKLQNAVSLEAALGRAGAAHDAAMGKWWVEVHDVTCEVGFEDSVTYACQFTNRWQ